MVIVLLVAIGIGMNTGFVYTLEKINKIQKSTEEKQHEVVYFIAEHLTKNKIIFIVILFNCLFS